MTEEAATPHNPYDKLRDPKRHNVCALLLSGSTVSWDELRDSAGGRLSPRTFAFILRELESHQHVSILKMRDPEYGTLYRYDASVPYDDHYRLSRATGPDGKRHLGQGTGERPSSLPMVEEGEAPPLLPEPVPGSRRAIAEAEAAGQEPEVKPPTVGQPLIDVLADMPANADLDALLSDFANDPTAMVFSDADVDDDGEGPVPHSPSADELP